MRELAVPRFLVWRTSWYRLPNEWIRWQPGGVVPLPSPTRAMWRGLVQTQIAPSMERARRAVGLEKPGPPPPPVLLVGLPREGQERDSVVICVAEPVEGPKAVVPGYGDRQDPPSRDGAAAGAASVADRSVPGDAWSPGPAGNDRLDSTSHMSVASDSISADGIILRREFE